MAEDRQFQIFQHRDGTFVSYREREPLFCFVKDTEREAVELAEKALDEYQAMAQSPLRLYEDSRSYIRSVGYVDLFTNDRPRRHD